MAVVMVAKTFVGTLFVASPMVPEMPTVAAAPRRADMAIGNLFGSNLFDIAIVAVDDVFFFPGPILRMSPDARDFPFVGHDDTG
jgi:cation:H+ antiporter